MPWLLLLALSTLWGASYTFIRVGVETIPPLTLIAARTVIASLLLLAWLRASKAASLPTDTTSWRQFVLQALLNSVVPFTLLAWAERDVEAGIAAILNSTSPVIAFVAMSLRDPRQSITGVKLFGVGAGLAGTCLVIGPSALHGPGGPLIPQLAIVAATVCYAGAAIYGRTFNRMHPAVPAAGSLIAGSVLLVPASLIVDHPWSLRPSAASLWALGALAVFSTALALVIYFHLVKVLGSLATTAQAYLRVPIGVAIGFAFLGESIAPSAWWGLACVVAGVAAMVLPATGRNSTARTATPR